MGVMVGGWVGVFFGVTSGPADPLRAAVTLHHPTLHLGQSGHLATGARVRCSWTRGYWEINRYASARASAACLPGWLAGQMTTALPHRPFLPSPRLPHYGQMKTMQFWLFHHLPRTQISCYGARKCLCGSVSSDVSALSNPPPFPPIFWIEKRRDGN